MIGVWGAETKEQITHRTKKIDGNAKGPRAERVSQGYGENGGAALLQKRKFGAQKQMGRKEEPSARGTKPSGCPEYGIGGQAKPVWVGKGLLGKGARNFKRGENRQ